MILTVEGLTKSFTLHHLGQTMGAFRDLSFTLAAGEFLLLRGPNGVGKSTLLRTIWRSYLPDGGHVWLHREAMAASTWPARRMWTLPRCAAATWGLSPSS